jgi:K+-sensing histidine kinase KdpD
VTVEGIDPLRKVLHDVRTPLAVICGYVELLQRRDEALTHDQRESYLAEVRKAAEDIGAILDAARPSAGG